jgi:serine/threonine-protein kinase
MGKAGHEFGSATDSSLPPEVVRAAVERIIASPLFSESRRLSGFLRYLVEETLAGRSDRIKEYNIGVEVYERPQDYDPKTDAIVRVEAGRLRGKLAKYYASEGSSDPVRIKLPRGTYVPVLVRAGPPEPRRSRSAWPLGTRLGKVTVIGFGALAILAIGVFRHPSRDRALSRDTALPSLAVLPFLNVTGDSETGRFATDLVEELTSRIATENVFLVASRTESDQFSKSPNLQEVASKLRVSVLLEGSVRRDSDRLGVTVQLMAARNGYQIWSQTYKSLPGRSAEFRETVSDLIARTLRARFGGLSELRLTSPLSRSEEAMSSYLKGREAWLTQRKAGLFDSLNEYLRAIEKDPGFAKPYEGIAASELFLASLDQDKADDHVARAKAAAQKAIALDDRLADPHARLGNIFLRREWNFVEAERELQRAVVLEPGSSPITRWYSEAARLREKYEDARTELENGLLANANSEMIETELGLLDFELDRIAEAEVHIRRSLAVHPGYRLAHWVAGLLLERAGQFGEAEHELHGCANESEFGRLCLAALGHLYGVEQKRRESNQTLRQLEASANRSMSLAAVVYLGMGDRDAALEALERAYAERDKFLPLVKIDPRFRPLQFDTRFRTLMKRLGLPTAV